MKNLSFCALVNIPSASYFEFNTALSGIGTIDSISREGSDKGDTYNANIEFDLAQLTDIVSLIQTCGGELVEIVPDKEVAHVPQVVNAFVKKRKQAITTKKEEMIKLLGKWQSTKDLMKATGWKSSTIHARLTGLRKAKKLHSKNGPNNYMVYRIAGAAA